MGNLPSKFGHTRPLGSGIIRYVSMLWFVIAHWVITFDLSSVLCLSLTLPFFLFSWRRWLKLSFNFFLVLVWISLGDCYLVRLHSYVCLLYFCNLTAVFRFPCSLCSLTFLSIKTTTTTMRRTDRLTDGQRQCLMPPSLWKVHDILKWGILHTANTPVICS